MGPPGAMRSDVVPTRIVRNPLARPPAEVPAPATSAAPLAFHRRLPGYEVTPLLDRPQLAEALGVGRVLVKDESWRLGLPAFKMLGASWATYRALVDRLGSEPAWSGLEELSAAVARLEPLTLVTATDGNHGRALARMARLVGLPAHIYVPGGTAQARVEAIASEGARVDVVDGSYDEAVRVAGATASHERLIVSDTSWPGYEETPRRVVEGYSTIFLELEDQLAAAGLPPPDVVPVQMGVGALAAAVIGHWRGPHARRPARVIGVEPATADCVLAAVLAGRIVEVPGPHRSSMAGLNCGLASPTAWPIVSAGLDALVALDDARTCDAVRELADAGVVAGESGAAGLAGVRALQQRRPGLAHEVGLTPEATLLLITTEGATDPGNYARIVGARRTSAT